MRQSTGSAPPRWRSCSGQFCSGSVPEWPTLLGVQLLGDAVSICLMRDLQLDESGEQLACQLCIVPVRFQFVDDRLLMLDVPLALTEAIFGFGQIALQGCWSHHRLLPSALATSFAIGPTRCTADFRVSGDTPNFLDQSLSS